MFNFEMDVLETLYQYHQYQYSLVLASAATLWVFTLISGYYYCQNKYSYWTKRGLGGPKPWPFIGNLVDIFADNRGMKQMQWRNQFGKVYGIYEGLRPVLVVGDPELLRQICIKDFDQLPNHPNFPLMNKYLENFIFQLQDQPWKKVRSLMTPTFTSGKMRRMYRLLDRCANDLVDLFSEQFQQRVADQTSDSLEAINTGVEVNLKTLYNMYSLDGIASCCYGLHLQRQSPGLSQESSKTTANRDEFVQLAMKIFIFDMKRFILAEIVNRKLLKWLNFEVMPKKNIEGLVDKVQQLIRNRKNTDRKFDDYLQILIDSNLDDKLELNELDERENHHAGLTRDSMIQDQAKLVSSLMDTDGQWPPDANSKRLSNIELLSQATFLLAVGLETTSNLLISCTYALAFHQEIQQKLFDEIKSIANYNEKGANNNNNRYTFDYDKLTSCNYLDSVLSETLRRFPPAMETDREVKETYRIDKYKVVLEPGTKISLYLSQIMMDPDYWPEPEKFDPERFMPANRDSIVPDSYCPFGIGPRHCVGMRFSLTEAKLALSKVVMQYKFEPAKGHEFPPEIATNLGLGTIKRPLIRISPRVQ